MILLVSSLQLLYCQSCFSYDQPKVENDFVKRKHLEGTYLVWELRSA